MVIVYLKQIHVDVGVKPRQPYIYNEYYCGTGETTFIELQNMFLYANKNSKIDILSNLLSNLKL